MNYALRLLPVVCLLTANAFAADEKPRARVDQPLISPEVAADRTVTFRVKAPGAKEVKITGEKPINLQSMVRDEAGVWSISINQMPAEIYSYSFLVDGLRIADPSNPTIKPGRATTASLVEVPGDPPLLHEFQDVPHGTVRMVDYRSKSLNVVRHVRVYTPPGYDAEQATRYPVLYLLHGAGDNDSGWTEIGRAHLIIDNLIAQKKVKPMLIVMPNGHTPRAATGPANLESFERDLMQDVVPLVEKSFRVKADREHRAIIGLSMGCMQSLSIGLSHVDDFAWVGGMSGYVRDAETSLAKTLNDPKANVKLKALWIAVGKEDGVLTGAKEFDALLSKHQIKHEFIVTDGGHSWPVWRKHLAQFTPLLFTGE